MRYLALLVLSSLACEPASATDQERARREMRAMLARNAERGEHDRFMRELHAEFSARFAGTIQAGVGCDVCPHLCKRADLRQVPVTELHRMYREAALQFGYPANHRTYQLAGLELDRLGCVGQDGLPATRAAWLPLLDATEDPAIRYAAAVQAIQYDIAPEPALHALAELAAGSSKFVDSAAIRLDEWKLGIVPSL